MGCDIHLHVEYKAKNDSNWCSFAQPLTPRDYLMFGIMAKGVRSDMEKGFKLKGLPEDASWITQRDNRHYISDIKEEGYVDLETAKGWVERGMSRFINNDEGRPTWVTNPDWHSHSSLSTKEFTEAIDIYNELKPSRDDLDIEYTAILALLEHFQNNGHEARVVFWFDN